MTIKTFLLGATSAPIEYIGTTFTKLTSASTTISVDIHSDAKTGDFLLLAGGSGGATGSLSNFDGFTNNLNDISRFGGHIASWDGTKSTYSFTHTASATGHLAMISVFRNAELDEWGALSEGGSTMTVPAVVLTKVPNILYLVGINHSGGTTVSANFITPTNFSIIQDADALVRVRQVAWTSTSYGTGSTGTITLVNDSLRTASRAFLVGLKQK